MPEQQKVDDVVESASIIDKKKITKLEKSSTALEKDQDDAVGVDVDDPDGDAGMDAVGVDVDDPDGDAGMDADSIKE